MPDSLTPTDLAEYREAAEKASAATDGYPWLAHSYEGQTKMGDHKHSVCAEMDRNERHRCVGDVWHEDEDQARELAEFIALSRTAVPRLVEEVERLRAERDEVRAQADLRSAQLLMVASEICGDSKLNDRRDPRWTPALHEAQQLRADRAALLEALEPFAEATRRLIDESNPKAIEEIFIGDFINARAVVQRVKGER